MKLSVTNDRIEQVKTGLLVIPFIKGGVNRAFDFTDRRSRGSLRAQVAQESFKGEEGRLLVWQGSLRGGGAVRVVLVGMGKGSPDAATWKTNMARTINVAIRHREKAMTVFVDSVDSDRKCLEASWTTEALMLGAYRFDRRKTQKITDRPPRIGRVGVYPPQEWAKEVRGAIKDARVRAEAVLLCRDLVNEPANILYPERFADIAVEIADAQGLDCKVMNKKAIQKAGMNLLMAVAQGSSRDPRFIHLIYKPSKDPVRKIALIGKGVTFDSGGLCIKPGKSMANMKTDMAGAGVVLAVMSSLSKMGFGVEVHGIIPLAENSINGQAARPGDVIESLSGLSVEIINTDAEGRLLLADALSYASDLEPDEIIDLATLTGSCPTALGALRAGLFASEDQMADRFIAAADGAGELVWRLPLAGELKKDLRSDVADIKNLGGRWGGAITAALFLRRFVKDRAWMHLDIAGPARTESTTPLCRCGGTGFGVATCLEYLSRI